MTENILYAYVNNNNIYDKYIIKNTASVIASFIMQNWMYECIITDFYDNTIIHTVVGGIIDYCKDQLFLSNELLPVLVPMQLGLVAPEPLTYNESENHYIQIT